MAVLMITHDLNLVRRFADRVAVMQHGRLVEQGATAQIFAAPQHAYTQKLMASKPERDVVEAPPDADAQPVLAAQDLRVTYLVPRPGIRGWFGKDGFVAAGRQLCHPARAHARGDRRIGPASPRWRRPRWACCRWPG